MNVALFDLHSGGYHLERGNRLVRTMTDRDAGIEVEYLSTAVTEKHEEHFPEGTLVSIPVPAHSGHEESYAYRKAAVGSALERLADSQYDVVHFLEVDDILVFLEQHLDSEHELPQLVGTLDGGRFFRNTRRYRASTAATFDSTGNMVLTRLYDALYARGGDAGASHTDAVASILDEIPTTAERLDPVNELLYSLFKPIAMQQILERGLLDHVFVQSQPARAYLEDLCDQFRTESVSVVPDPADIWFDRGLSKADARSHLGIDTDETVLLTFGELRAEKGIDLLLEALRRYQGPAFTMVLVGKPVDISPEAVKAAKAEIDIPLLERLEFVPEADIPEYFIATDGVVIPYRPSFGLQRTSGPFQKACATCRPVLVPRFGMFEERTERLNLGRTFTPNDPDDLAAKLASFVKSPERAHDPEATKRYARSQTYDALVDDHVEVYRTVASRQAKSKPVSTR